MLLLVDNYDSFTFNLVQRLGEIDRHLPVHVVRNDAITIDEAIAHAPTHIIISPGPGTPTQTGICAQLIERFRGRAAILGVCLGHQVIAEAHGMPVTRHAKPMHGKTSRIHHDNRGLFRGLPNPFIAARYHSLIVRREDVHADFEVSAWTEDDEIMGLRWRPVEWPAGKSQQPMDGVQFHPESYLTEVGPQLLANFLDGVASAGSDANPTIAAITQ